jgi:small subunit ribosomal protein S3
MVCRRKDYADNLFVDLRVREFVKKKLAAASVSRVEIERPAQTAKVTVYTARPGIVIGKKGEDVEKLRNTLTQKWASPFRSISKKFASLTSMLSS